MVVMIIAAFGLGLGVSFCDGRLLPGNEGGEGILQVPPAALPGLRAAAVAFLLALVTYTASHIAEIVRGSIQAVPRGQGEAAKAMALSGVQQMRFVVLPQAFRIAIPPMANQYLNLMKNSSLGFVISYFDLTKVVSTSIGTRSPAIPAYTVLILIYLALSLIISLVMNAANRRMELPSR